MQTFDYRFRVPLHDIDAAGVMFFAHLYRHAHDAYEAFMAEVGYPLDGLLREGNYLLPLVASEAKFQQPLFHGDTITVRLDLARVGNSSFTVRYRFLDQEGNQRAELTTSHVWIGAADRRTAPLPEELRNALQPYLQGAGEAGVKP